MESRVSFWNSSGFSRWDTREFCDLTEIICLCETWTLEENPTLPLFLKDYQPVWIRASKSVAGSRGRGSGGLLTLIKNDINYEIIDTCDLWCCVKVDLNDFALFVISIYFNQKVNFSVALEALQAIITNIYDKYDDPKICIGGDFNCRIGENGDCSPVLIENSILLPNRISLDRERPSANSY